MPRTGKKPVFFPTPAKFRDWLERHHSATQELWVGFYKKSTGKPSITWSESVDVALCFGWIDGIRKSIDESSYKIRFTPRRTASRWSAINIKKIQELQKRGLMQPEGIKVFEQRKEPAGYSYEDRHSLVLDPQSLKTFRTNRKAWEFFQKQPPSYKKICLFWVMSAKQEATRERRLSRLIETSGQQKRLS